MKTIAFGWLALLLIPGCLLVQPLDAAKPEDDGSAGSGNSSGKPSQAGSAGQHAGGSSSGGSGDKAGSGPLPPGGAANGGAPNSGVDFSLFTGTWTITSGKDTVTCEGATPQITNTTPGLTDEVGLGTTSDLIFDPGSDCEVLADVTDHTASLNSDTSDCVTSDTDTGYVFDVTFDSFEFVVSADEQTAKATVTSSIVAVDADGATSNCTSEHSWNYRR